MKRPLARTALWLLAGVMSGIPLVPVYAKAAVWILAIVSVITMAVESRDLGKGTLLFLCTFAVITFSIGILRGKAASAVFESPELSSFYEKYEATNPGEFDYALYLKGMGITCAEERERMGEPQLPLLVKVRECFGKILDENLTEHDAGIYHAMLLGDKTLMDPVVKELYQTSGIAHLLAVSGLHISLIGMGLFRILRKKLRFSMDVSLLLSAAAAFLYVGITGASASAIRAGIMLSVNLLSRKKGRSYDLLSSLSAAFILLVIRNPYVIFLSGFQLSFGAMAGIFLGNEVTLSLFPAGILRKRPAVLSSLISSLSVTLFTLPVTLSGYYFFPPFSVLLNLLVIPLMTVVMVSGLLVLLFGTVGADMLCFLAVSPGHAVLAFYEWICKKASMLPFSRVVTGKPSGQGILLYYAVFLLCFCCLSGTLSVRKAPSEESRRKRRRKDLQRILITLCIPVSIGFLKYREPCASYVEALDVGQGDCFHIHEGDRDILLDGGSSGYEKIGEKVIEPYLLSRGIADLDAVIVSHADSDHTNGIRYLLTDGTVSIGTLLLPQMAQTDEKYGELKSGKYETLHYLRTGDRMQAGKTVLGCVYVGEGAGAERDTNRQSDVILLRRGAFSMLFTGDMTKEDELLLLKSEYGERIGNIDVLKVAHHGSKTASGKVFLERVRPEYTLLSYRKGNRFGHPHKETTDALEEGGAKLLKTPETGAVKIIMKEDGYEIESFLTGSEK